MNVRQSYALTLCAIVGSGLAACTTMPPPPETPSVNIPNISHLCSGDHIDNAPPTDHKRHILGYEPLARVAGVTVWRAPVRRACFSSGFGRRHDRSGRHNGIDLSTGHAHAVYAGGDGVVEEMHIANGYGRMLLIRHNSRVQTRYGHLSAYASELHVGHEVRLGEVIGRTGQTGNATAVILHYEIIVDGVPRDPMTVD